MGTEQPLVTVIIPSYNHEKYVEHSILSVVDQTYDNLEIIIIDDGSTDGTIDVIKKTISNIKNRKVLFLTQKNIGLSCTLNKGINISTGELITCIASDDMYMQTRITELVDKIKNTSSHVGAVYSDGYFMTEYGEIGNRISMTRVVPISHNIHRELIVDNWIPGGCVLYKRHVFSECGLFNEEVIMEDYDFLLRMTRNFSLIYLDKPLYLYRMHQTNISRDSDKMEKAMATFLLHHPEVKEYHDFKGALKNVDLSYIVRHFSLSNTDLLMRYLARKIKQRYYQKKCAR